MKLVTKTKEILRNMNWWATAGVMTLPVLSELIHALAERETPYNDIGDFIMAGSLSAFFGGLMACTTAREKTEKIVKKALKVSEEKFRNLFESSPAGMVLTGKSGKIIDVNESFTRQLDYTREELLSKGFSEISSQDDSLEENLRLFAETVEGKRDHYRIIKKYITKKGDEVWGDLSVNAVRDEDGQFKYCVSSIIDVTNQKEAELQLKAEKEKLVSVLDSMDEGITIQDRNYRILSHIQGASATAATSAGVL